MGHLPTQAGVEPTGPVLELAGSLESVVQVERPEPDRVSGAIGVEQDGCRLAAYPEGSPGFEARVVQHPKGLGPIILDELVRFLLGVLSSQADDGYLV